MGEWRNIPHVMKLIKMLLFFHVRRRRLCAVHARCGCIVYLLTMINFTDVIYERAFSYQLAQLYCDFLFFSHNVYKHQIIAIQFNNFYENYRK